VSGEAKTKRAVWSGAMLRRERAGFFAPRIAPIGARLLSMRLSADAAYALMPLFRHRHHVPLTRPALANVTQIYVAAADARRAARACSAAMPASALMSQNIAARAR